MLPAAAMPWLFQLAGKGLSEHAEKRVWTGALTRRFQVKRKIATGVLERRNPLPKGRYWIDIFQSGRQDWDYWTMYSTGHLKVINEEHYSTDGTYESRDWILFETDAPLTWDIELAKKIGWPTVATPEVQNSDDTVQKPKVKGGFDEVFGDSPGLKIAVTGVGIVAAAVLVGYVVRSFK